MGILDIVKRSPIDNSLKFAFPVKISYCDSLVPDTLKTFTVPPAESSKFKVDLMKLGLEIAPFQLKQTKLPCFSTLNVFPRDRT